MHFKILTITILLAITSGVSSTIIAQDIDEWKIYSSYSTVHSIDLDSNNVIYASSLGGVFTINDGEISQFTTADGLSKLNANSVLLDQDNGQLILGYSDGTIDIIDLENYTIDHLYDVQRVSQFTNKGINDMLMISNSVYLATDFGIVVLNPANRLILNSFLQLGEIERGTKVHALATFNDSIYVATELGIVQANLNDNLLDASSWYLNEIDTDDVSSNASDIVISGNQKYAIINDTLWSNVNSKWETPTNLDYLNSVKLGDWNNHIVVAYQSSLMTIDSLGSTEIIYSNSNITIEDFKINNQLLVIGTSQNGVLKINLSTNTEDIYLPDGPYLNYFSELEFSDNILLASATDQFPQTDPFNSVRGYYLYNGQKWSNYNRNTNSVLATNMYSTAYTVNNGEDYYFVGSWGSGMVMHDKETDEIEVYNYSNSGFSGIADNRNFVVIPGIDTDKQGNTWATSFISDYPLNVYSNSDEQWYHFETTSIPSTSLYYRLFADSFDNLWITLIDISNNGKGLLVLKPGTDIASDIDDNFRLLTDAENNGNLPDVYVSSIIEDRNGEIWVGTKRGIARFIFPEYIVDSSNSNDYKAQWLINSDTSAVSRYLLRDIEVSAMAVNSANEKWIGSVNQGIWVISEDGSEIIERYTTSNSPLISNNIQSIAIDDKTGEVFISTDQGLISYTDVSSKAIDTMDELKIFPNPFVYNVHDELLIEGLTEQTLIRVLGVDGSVVHEFETRGGRVSWNGIDYLGNELATGVYFVVAISTNGSEKGIGKVVIIR